MPLQNPPPLSLSQDFTWPFKNKIWPKKNLNLFTATQLGLKPWSKIFFLDLLHFYLALILPRLWHQGILSKIVSFGAANIQVFDYTDRHLANTGRDVSRES